MAGINRGGEKEERKGVLSGHTEDGGRTEDAFVRDLKENRDNHLREGLSAVERE
jgi:hypothetical protein